MPQSLHLTAADRLLFFAPHPDDEALAAGGLVQKAVVAGAQMRLVFVTNGDRNPWPQRVFEKRIFLDAQARPRWGARRRQEALHALTILGLGEPAEAHFLNWPDQGVMSLLMAADDAAIETICGQIAAWRPSHVIAPAAEDVHPDHSALFVLVQFALDRSRRRGLAVRHVLSYLVHRPSAPLALDLRPVRLSPAERTRKADAIQAHETQMLSRRRFLAHARETEPFHLPLRPPARHLHHPVRSADQGRGALRLKLKLPKPFLSFRGATIHLALETLLAGSLRWSLPLPGRTAAAPITDAVTGRTVRSATVRITGRSATVCLPIAAAQPLARLFVKFDRRRIFFDIAGWRELPVDQDRGPKVRLHRFDPASRSASAE